MLYMTRCIIRLDAPLHCGGGADNGFDQPVIRDAFGVYRIPGSSIAGVLRAHAAAFSSGQALSRAFGAIAHSSANGTDAASQFWFSDGLLLDFDLRPAADKLRQGQECAVPLGPYIRDHVRMDPDRGCAEEGGKFDAEYVPAGARFFLEFSLDGWNREPDAEALDIFKNLCALLRAGRVRFGGKSAGGFGAFTVLEMQCRRFDLHNEQAMTAWLNLAHAGPFAEDEGEDIPPHTAGPEVDAGAKHSGISGSLCLDFVSDGPLLVGGGLSLEQDADAAKEADIRFTAEPWFDYERQRVCLRRLIPGSSIRGVVRHRVYHVARALGASAEEAQTVLDGLFGHVKGKSGAPGKLRFADAVPAEHSSVVVQHVAIDRFTGGALDGALYSEAPVWTPDLRLVVAFEAENVELWEAALLTHALADLGEGRVPIGRGGTRGNGFLRLAATDAQGLPPWKAALRHDGKSIALDSPEAVTAWLERLDAALTSCAWRRI